MKTKIAVLLVMFVLMTTLVFASQQKVLGKLHIKKGVDVLILLKFNEGAMPLSGTAFEDQTVYITKIIKEGEETFYRADGDKFIHDCPAHGREVLGADVMGVTDIIIIVPKKAVDGDKFKVEMFK